MLGIIKDVLSKVIIYQADSGFCMFISLIVYIYVYRNYSLNLIIRKVINLRKDFGGGGKGRCEYKCTSSSFV